MKRFSRTFAPLAVLIALVAVAGCHKKPKTMPAGETAPPPATTPAPTAQLTATPSTISAGDQVVLTWR
ncbi:MAG TPA: hypothetical protein VMU71_08760, partial [Terracidiphilus sp.]|nr:hypothetical protein [Terracidiphilus sp.]